MTYTELITFFEDLGTKYTTDLIARAIKEAFSPEKVALLIERLSV